MFNRYYSAFQVCGYTGLVLAVLLSMILAIYRGLSPLIMGGVIGTAMLTFLGLAMATKIITGEEQLIYYHHEIAIMIMAAIFLKLLNQPLLLYLDITILGIGIFLACGRVGCLMVGCCHGRPHKLGVCYRTNYGKIMGSGNLFPIQIKRKVLSR
jgi:prolipoprotein diacylglyceryltransferase